MKTSNQLQTMALTYAEICQGETPWVALGNFMNDWFDFARERREQLVCEPIVLPPQRSRRCCAGLRSALPRSNGSARAIRYLVPLGPLPQPIPWVSPGLMTPAPMNRRCASGSCRIRQSLSGGGTSIAVIGCLRTSTSLLNRCVSFVGSNTNEQFPFHSFPGVPLPLGRMYTTLG